MSSMMLPVTEEEALAAHSQAQQWQLEGRHREAAAAFEPVAAFFANAEGEASPDLANVLIDWSESLQALCKYQDAEEKARRGKTILYELRDRLDPDTRGTLLPRAACMWGRSLRELGRYEEAAISLLDAIKEAERHYGLNHRELADWLNEYGILCKYWGRYDEGLAYYRRALRILEDEFGKEAPETASLYHNLGGLAHTRGHFSEGEPLARKAFEIRLRAFGVDHPGTVADEVAWGGLLDGLKRFDESVPIYRRALTYYEQRLGPGHFEVAATLNNLGMARGMQGDAIEAQALLARSLGIKRTLFLEDHPEVALTAANLESFTA